MPRTLRRLGLATAVIALVLTAVWYQRHDARRNDPGTLTTLEASQIKRIVLTLPTAPPMHYEHRDGHWWRVDSAPARANDGRLRALAETAAAPVMSWRPAGDFEPSKIGLTPPQAILELDGLTLEFGETSATNPLHYVRVGDRVALVPSRYMPRSPAVATVELE